jgi:hypothetical protein
MTITFAILAAATAVGTIGQFLDAYTTNYGVNIAKVATEGNSAATGLVAHPVLNFLVKAGGPLAAGLLGLFLLPHLAPDVSTSDGMQIFISLILSAAGVWGFSTAKTNAKINGGWHL